jgi:hypothetical protein
LPQPSGAVMVSTSTALPARLVAMQVRWSTMEVLGSCKHSHRKRMRTRMLRCPPADVPHNVLFIMRMQVAAGASLVLWNFYT